MTIAPVELIHYDDVDYKIPVDPKIQAGELTRRLLQKVKDIQVNFEFFLSLLIPFLVWC